MKLCLAVTRLLPAGYLRLVGWCGMYIEIMTGKRKSFSFNEKHSLLEAYDKLPKMSQLDAGVQLGVTQATLCSWLKQPETFTAASDGDSKQTRMGRAPVVGAALLNRLMSGHVMPPW